MTPKAQHKALERERRRYEREMARATLRELRLAKARPRRRRDAEIVAAAVGAEEVPF
jgi:hypothetical protein